MKKKLINEAFLSMLEGRDLQINRPFNGLFGGNRPSPFFGSSVEFAEFREYLPGDDLRHLDTNLYARFEKLYIKQYIDERRLHHRIYLDASRSMDWGEPPKGEFALMLCAALGYIAIRNWDTVSFFALHGEDCTEIASNLSGKEAFYRGANALNKVKFYGDFRPVSALGARDDQGNNDGLAILISDFLNDDWQAVADLLCQKKKQVQFIQILSRDEISPDLYGKILLIDSEGEDEEDERHLKRRVNRQRIKAYHAALNYHRQQIKDYCAKNEIGFLTLCSDEEIERFLFLKATEGGLVK
ncbi:MAG: DUF58 domain-containing protein [Clostridia bacterium]|nr:DUF58 domain-containing protein [Clostridia bacterium]